MDPSRLKRSLTAVAGVFAAAAVMFALLFVINGRVGFIGCTGTSALGWTMPPLAGILIGGVAWALLSKAPHYSDDVRSRRSVPCPSCEKAVMEDWRMCPYCGRVLSPESPAEQAS